MREPLMTSVMSSGTAAVPERVWQALTGAAANLGVPPGIGVACEWSAGSRVRLGPVGSDGRVDGLSSFGEVLCSIRPLRLSYTLGAGAGGADPTMIVTWEIERDAGGSTVRLTIDDLVPGGSHDDEIRSAWHEVVTSLTRALDHPAHGDRTVNEH